MKKNPKMPDLRRRNLISISLICFISIILANCLHVSNIGWVTLLKNSILAIISAVTICLMTETSRIYQCLDDYKTNDFSFIRKRVFIVAILYIAYSYLPFTYSLPVIFPFVLIGVCGTKLTLVISLIMTLNNMLLISCEGVEVVSQCILLILSVLLADMSYRFKKQCMLILFFACFMTELYGIYYIGVMPDYLDVLKIGGISFAYTLVAMALSFKLDSRMQIEDCNLEESDDLNGQRMEENLGNEALIVSDNEQNIDYTYYISDKYPLVKDIMKYDMTEYNHARNLQKAASICAKAIDANVELTEMAAFYYRLGILQGEPILDNSLKMAYDYCFPKSVMKILEEYDGIYRAPQSKESAIIHMSNACLIKAEMLRAKKLSSNWNQDMVIYQTLNELSATGIYDNSGISMNQFLVIRDVLVKEGLNV